MRLKPGVTSLFQIALERPSASGWSQSVDNRRHHDPAILVEPPRLDAGEITDKSYINQRAVLRARQAQVQALYAEHSDAEVILPAR